MWGRWMMQLEEEQNEMGPCGLVDRAYDPRSKSLWFNSFSLSCI